jgi:glycosyltransferase involved in cell wall biosynthesis
MKMPAIRHSWRLYRAVNQMFVPSMMERFQPDIVHETYYSQKRKASAGTKVVLTVFDMIHERFPDSFRSWDSTSMEKAVAVERADHVVCISEQTRKDLIELFVVDQAKTSVIHLGFSLTKQSVDWTPVRDRPYLLFVGSRGGYKNFESLLHTYAANPALHHDYDLVAFGGGSLNAREKALVAKLGIPFERMRHLSGDDSVLSGLYRRAALFVYPSRYEGFGIPPLEAMSFDCPVVCSNTSAIPEVVGDAAEFFDPDSIESIGRAIERVLNDEALRQTLVAGGRERVKQFSWERCAEQTFAVYRGLLT